MGISTDAVLLLGNYYHEMKEHIEKAVGYIPPPDDEDDEEYDFYELMEQFAENTGIELYSISPYYDAYIEHHLVGVIVPLQLSSIGIDVGVLEMTESNVNAFKETIMKEYAELKKHLPDAPLQLRVTPWVT